MLFQTRTRLNFYQKLTRVPGFGAGFFRAYVGLKHRKNKQIISREGPSSEKDPLC